MSPLPASSGRNRGRAADPCAEIVGLLLAAGSSTRFGADKLVQPTPGDDEWIAVKACRNLLRGVDRVVAVVRPDQDSLPAALKRAGAEVAVCELAERGMSASIAAGVAHAAHASGWLIALADMPWIAPETISAVASAIRRGAGIAAPTFQGRRGHPVGFAAAHRESLLGLSGDHGARDLLRDQASDLRLIPCDDPGVLLDIDVPDDLGLAAPTALGNASG